MSIARVKAKSKNPLFEKIESLPPERVAEVEDFVDFLRERAEDDLLAEEARVVSAEAFRRVWDNPADARYDQL